MFEQTLEIQKELVKVTELKENAYFKRILDLVFILISINSIEETSAKHDTRAENIRS